MHCVEHQYKRTQNVPDYDVEHSEVLLYHIRVLEELGEYQDGLNLLDVNAKSRAIIDRTAIMEFRGECAVYYTNSASHIPYRRPARLLTKLGEHDDAEHTWQALIEQNPDCHKYYTGYFSNRDIDIGTNAL